MDFSQPKTKEGILESRPHNQVIHFDNKTKATITNIIQVWQDTFVHIITKNGNEYLINPERVLYTEFQWHD